VSQVFSLLGFVAHLETIKRDMHTLGPMIIEKACAMVAAEARRVIGKGYDDWPALKPETMAERVRLGFKANEPLLRTGQLRDSIEWNSQGNQGWVGSNDPVAVWQELGTSRIPPRPFLAGAAAAMGPKIEKMAARAVIATMAGRGLHSAEMRELLHVLHLLKEVAHKVKEDIIDPALGDEERGR
jgi:phage gpG-like protein